MRWISPRARPCISDFRRTACDVSPDSHAAMSPVVVNPLAHGAAPKVKPIAHWQDRLAQGLLLGVCAFLVVFLLAPLFMILVKSVEDKSGAFVGLRLFQEYFQTPALRLSI